jgi:hypothetical protein
MQRPVGVTILAVLYFLGTCLLTLVGIVALVGMGFLSRILAQNPDVGESGAALIAGAGVFVGIFLLALAALCGFVGYGLWNLRSWARTTALVLAFIGAFFACLGVLWGILRFAPVRLIISGVRLGIHVLIIWYLNQPHVKAAFAMPAVPQVGMGGPAGTIR